MNASRRPFFLSPERFKKNDNVIGMIGQTHGVNKATNPPSKPKIKIVHNEESVVVVFSPKSLSWSITGVYRSLTACANSFSVSSESVLAAFSATPARGPNANTVGSPI